MFRSLRSDKLLEERNVSCSAPKGAAANKMADDYKHFAPTALQQNIRQISPTDRDIGFL